MWERKGEARQVVVSQCEWRVRDSEANRNTD